MGGVKENNMAERLTEKDGIENKRYVLNSEDNQIILTSAKLKNGFRKTYYYGKPIDKLAQLEDIMEKYGVDIQNLDYILEDYSKNQGRYFAICEEMDGLKKDRDAWKRACELACKWFKQTGFIGDQTKVDYYYQQAKKEGNDDK